MYLIFRTPFCEDISGIAIAKLWGLDGEISTLKIRLKNNYGIVEFVNNTNEEVTFLPKTVIGVLDLRSLGYFKVNYENLVQRMGEYFTFFHYYKDTSDGTSDSIFNRMHEISNDVRHDIKSTKDPHPWLEPDGPRRHHTDAEILRSQISLKRIRSDFNRKVPPYNYDIEIQKAFSLQDEIGNCPNIKADIKVIDESPFLSDHSRVVRKTNLSYTDRWRG